LWCAADPDYGDAPAVQVASASRAPLGELSGRLGLRGSTFDRLVHSEREAHAVRRKLGAPAEAVLLRPALITFPVNQPVGGQAARSVE